MADFESPDVGSAGECLDANCERDADVAVKVDTGQIKHYCRECGSGRRVGHSRVEERVEL